MFQLYCEHREIRQRRHEDIKLTGYDTFYKLYISSAYIATERFLRRPGFSEEVM